MSKSISELRHELERIESLVEIAEEQRRQEAERRDAQRQIEAARRRLSIALGRKIDVEV